MYATQTIEIPITTSVLNRHITPKRACSPLKYTNKPTNWNSQTPRQLIHRNRPAQGITQTAQFTEIPWSSPLKHANHLVPWNTLLLHRPLGFYSMKQIISTIYPLPPPQQPYKNSNNTCKKTPQKLNGFQRGSLADGQPNPLPRLPFFLFCYATSKTFKWHFAGGPMVADIACWLFMSCTAIKSGPSSAQQQNAGGAIITQYGMLAW